MKETLENIIEGIVAIVVSIGGMIFTLAVVLAGICIPLVIVTSPFWFILLLVRLFKG